MKCLICSFQNNEVDEIFQHYVNFHLIDSANNYLKALFEIDNNSLLQKKCVVCNEMFHKNRDFKNHNFIKHYQVSGVQSANKPLNILKRHGSVH